MDVKDFKIQWFPGHMTRAKRMMQEQVKLVDVVVEMLDARVPLSSSNPLLQKLLQSKPKVIAFNKVDMADPAQTELWESFFKSRGLEVCQLDCGSGKGVKQLLAAVKMAAEPIQAKWLRKGVKNHPVRVMIVGVPNVGKSTLINRLAGKIKAAASDRPGVTRGQQWVIIGKGVELLDTPGVLWPSFENPWTGFALAVTGAVKEDVFDRRDAVELLIDFLSKEYPEALSSFYGFERAESDTAGAVMEKIGAARGCIKTGGVQDLNKVEQLVLRDFRTAKIGRFTVDRRKTS